MFTIFILEENTYIILTNFQFPLKEKSVNINRLDVLILWSLFLYHQNYNVSAKYLVILYFYWDNNADKSEYK